MNKKIFILLFGMIFLMGFLASVSAYQFYSYGFEDGASFPYAANSIKNATGWVITGSATPVVGAGATTSSYYSIPPEEGTYYYSMRQQGGSPSGGIDNLTRNFGNVGGDNFTFYYRNEKDNSGSSITNAVYFLNSVGAKISSIGLAQSTSSWAYSTLTVPAGTYYIRFYFRNTDSSYGASLSVDNIRFYNNLSSFVNLTSPSNNSYSKSPTNLKSFSYSVPGRTFNSYWTKVWNSNGTFKALVYNNTISGKSNFSSSALFSLKDGTYKWNVISSLTNGSGTYNLSAPKNFTLKIDATPPKLSITSPSGRYDYIYTGKNMTLTFIASDNIALNKVWYNYNGSNHSISGVSNGTSKTVYFNYQAGRNSLIVWANDSVGNYNHTTLNWGYKVEQKSITYPSQAIIQTQGTYILNFSASMVSDVLLVFGGTSYQATFIYPGYYSAYKTITMPVVAVPTNESFYFNITFSDGSTVQTNTYHTSVIPFSIDTCGTNTYHLLYYQFKDEDTLLNLSSPNTFNMSTQLLFYSGNNLFYNYSTSTNKIDAVSFCSSKNLTQYGFTMNIANRYSGANRTTGYNLTEYYNVQAQSLTTTKIPLKISLYALNAKDKPTYFQITYNNQFFEPESGVLLSLERFYPSLNGGTYITVQSPVTDSFGNAPAWFLTDSQQYKIVASQNGNILATYNNYFPQCQNPGINTCSLQLNAIGSVNNLPSFGTDLTYSTHYSNTTFATDFSTTTGLQHNFTLIGYYSNGSRLCSSSIFTSSGELTCTFSHSTNLISYFFYFYRDGQQVFLQQVNEGQTLGQSLGASAFVVAFLLVLLFGMMFITSPIMIIVGTLMGLIVASLFTLTGGGLLFGASSAFIFIALAGFILIWRISRSPYGR